MSRELNKIFDVQSRKARRDILDKFDLPADDKNKVLNQIGNNSGGNGNNVEFIDLGLPSGTLWCTCNLGAAKPEDSGIYYSYGDPKPYNVVENVDRPGQYNIVSEDGTIIDSNTFLNIWKFAIANIEDYTFSFIKYNIDPSIPNVDYLSELQPEDDVARMYDNSWRTPSKEELTELKDFTTQQFDGKGVTFTSSINGNSIYIPVYVSACLAISRNCSGYRQSYFYGDSVYGIMLEDYGGVSVSPNAGYGYNFKHLPMPIRPIKGGYGTKTDYQTDINIDYKLPYKITNMEDLAKIVKAMKEYKQVLNYGGTIYGTISNIEEIEKNENGAITMTAQFVRSDKNNNAIVKSKLLISADGTISEMEG